MFCRWSPAREPAQLVYEGGPSTQPSAADNVLAVDEDVAKGEGRPAWNLPQFRRGKGLMGKENIRTKCRKSMPGLTEPIPVPAPDRVLRRLSRGRDPREQRWVDDSSLTRGRRLVWTPSGRLCHGPFLLTSLP